MTGLATRTITSGQGGPPNPWNATLSDGVTLQEAIQISGQETVTQTATATPTVHEAARTGAPGLVTPEIAGLISVVVILFMIQLTWNGGL